jgi:mannosyltransferase
MRWPLINVPDSSGNTDGDADGRGDADALKIRPGDYLATFWLIFAVAAIARLPSCTESLWLDELHSAWSVWGDLGEVTPRATAGNQTPLYFWGLWVWKQCAGESELMLRLPSVLASSIAASIVAVGLVQTRRSLLAGTVAGLVMALESNSIFYGTELRPFAVVILLSAIACWMVAKGVTQSNDRLVHSTVALAIISSLAIAIQPTSIAVFAWLMGAQLFFIVGSARRKKPGATMGFSWISYASILTIILLIAGWFSLGVLTTAWQHRAQWDSVGQAVSPLQLWRIWPWMRLLVIPFLLGLIAASAAWIQSPHHLFSARSILKSINGSMAMIAVLVVLTYWITAATGIAPVFHRRYFVACLPVLAWACGDGIANAMDAVRHVKCPLIARYGMAVTIALIPLGCIAFSQRQSNRLWSGEIVAVRRGEGWREAVQWLQSNRTPEQMVWLCPGLIETQRLLAAEENQEPQLDPQWYLTFPLSGPYPWDQVTPITLSVAPNPSHHTIILRANRNLGENLLRAMQASGETTGKIYSFGGVQVIDLLGPV